MNLPLSKPDHDTRPQRIRTRPAYLNSPSIAKPLERNKTYTLNKNSALNKKIDACQRELLTTKIAQGGNIVLDLSSSTYELVKNNIPKFYATNQDYTAVLTTSKDENNLIVEEIYRIKNRLKNGSIGKYNKYTINMYHTKSRMLVNGREATTTFLNTHLPQIRATINSNKELLDQLDKEIHDALTTMSLDHNYDTNNKIHEQSDQKTIKPHMINLGAEKLIEKIPSNHTVCQSQQLLQIQDLRASCSDAITSHIDYNTPPSSTDDSNHTIEEDPLDCYPCPHCTKPVTVDDEGIECSRCSNWLHYHCEDLSKNQADIYEKNTSLNYICSSCRYDQYGAKLLNIPTTPNQSTPQYSLAQSSNTGVDTTTLALSSTAIGTSTLATPLTSNSAQQNAISINSGVGTTTLVSDNSVKKPSQLPDNISKTNMGLLENHITTGQLQNDEIKLKLREKALSKKEKDLKKLELDYKDKATQMAAKQAYIAKLETQIKELQKSNHLLTIKVAAQESIQSQNFTFHQSSATNSNNRNLGNPEQSHCQCSCRNQNQTVLEQMHIHNIFKTMECRIDLIEKSHQLEVQSLCLKIEQLEKSHGNNIPQQHRKNIKSSNQKKNSATSQYHSSFIDPSFTNQSTYLKQPYNIYPPQQHYTNLANIPTNIATIDPENQEDNSEMIETDNTHLVNIEISNRNKEPLIELKRNVENLISTESNSDIEEPSTNTFSADIEEPSTKMVSTEIESCNESALVQLKCEKPNGIQEQNKSKEIQNQNFLEERRLKHTRLKQQSERKTFLRQPIRQIRNIMQHQMIPQIQAIPYQMVPVRPHYQNIQVTRSLYRPVTWNLQGARTNLF